ncbi:hypothetical protein OG322_15120 [Streptomyces sp. NBC_01260]|uniref:hypothetical protein n=1 Tax=unclassified Streptomyces TaxID=2593676 RepID=UPI000FAC6153|nr:MULTISPECIES: hypothetical protein [unclassified Streptomyces]MCX4770691.1 hypothetical protein [Streptomyces sp. NBC_01285]RPK45772.1 hypothetical protein EES39_14555 [Streptomyces sp. ADI92-24]
MTQSGQGDEQQLPAVRPAHEGVVLPAGGGEPWTPGGPADQSAPAEGQPWGQPWGPQAPHQGAASQGPPQGHGQYGQQHGQYDQGQQAPAYGQEQQHGQYDQGQQGHQGQQGPAYGQPLPLPPAQPQGTYAQPLPPEAVPGMGMGGDSDATQYIAPVPSGPAPGGLPPENPAESTRYLGQGRQQGYQQPPAGGHAAPPAQGGQDSDATQYIPPVPGGAPYGIRPGTPGERPPPAEFDNLFRSDEPAGATQQMPRFDPAQQLPPQHQGPQQPPQAYQQAPAYTGPEGGPPSEGRDERRKRPAHVPLIAAVVVGCAVIGLGAGALLSGGDDDKDKDSKQPVASASSPAAQPTAKAAADPAKQQAEALDKLLADSNNSRAAVIGAVEKTKTCTDLDQAVADLKGAAQQRRDLVTRLKDLSVDKLPDNGRLTASLTKAWQASASADDHYAAWAEQAKSKKVCKHGRARTTPQTQQATVQSGEASKAKREASGLWNTIATKYGLTEREATAL